MEVGVVMSVFMFLAHSALAAGSPPNFGPDFHPSSEPNMNGDYVFSQTPGGTPGKFPKKFSDYPGGVEMHDAYSPPMTTRYSQVWWSPLAPTPFPDAMVKKYAGKKMAIVGWEIDQVMRTPQGDISVPISAHYNHHYVAQVIGAGSQFTKAKLSPGDPRAAELKAMSHGRVDWTQEQCVPPGWVGVKTPSSPSPWPSAGPARRRQPSGSLSSSDGTRPPSRCRSSTSAISHVRMRRG